MGRLHGVGAHARRPGRERAGAAVEVDHGGDRFRVAGREVGEIGVRHLAERAVVLDARRGPATAPAAGASTITRLAKGTRLRSATASATRPPKE